MRIGNDRRNDDIEINVISLIDVLLTLLMFFVLSTTFVQRTRMQVNLPKASAQERDMQAPALTVTVEQDGHRYVGSDEVLGQGVAPLKEAIAKVAGTDHDRPVVIRADAQATHQSVIEAMDALGQLGFTHLSIATTPDKTESQ